jgi:hypothetical protein
MTGRIRHNVCMAARDVTYNAGTDGFVKRISGLFDDSLRTRAGCESKQSESRK